MRVLSHLLLPRAALHRRYPSHALTAIEDAIEASERMHRAEIRVAIEVALDWRKLWRMRSARERALEVFAELGLWNTAERNGVLIYLLLAERDVEIVADHGFDERVSSGEWQRACTLMERELAAGRWRDGILVGIEAITVLLQREFPAVAGQNPNEQVDRPAVL
ncbi:MAG TPA: TPM domain-containing protein [Gammaproteobacteria bacterium]